MQDNALKEEARQKARENTRQKTRQKRHEARDKTRDNRRENRRERERERERRERVARFRVRARFGLWTRRRPLARAALCTAGGRSAYGARVERNAHARWREGRGGGAMRRPHRSERHPSGRASGARATRQRRRSGSASCARAAPERASKRRLSGAAAMSERRSAVSEAPGSAPPVAPPRVETPSDQHSETARR